jgi:hypothetical protein
VRDFSKKFADMVLKIIEAILARLGLIRDAAPPPPSAPAAAP